MQELSLSDAIRLGSLAINDPAAGDIDRCAIAMALAANGGVDAHVQPIHCTNGEDDDEDYDEAGHDDLPDGPVILRSAEKKSWRDNNAYDSHLALIFAYPWLEKAVSDCPWCGVHLRSTELLHHPFDEHVMTGTATIDALASWIAQLEPDPYAIVLRPPSLDLGLGIRFSDEKEKKTIIEAAAAVHMKPDEYIAAAVRLVVERGLVIEQFRKAPPQVGPDTDVSYAPFMRGERPSCDSRLDEPELVGGLRKY